MNTIIDPASAERVRHLIVFPADCGPSYLRVVAAACLLDGVIYAMPPPARHHNVIHEMAERDLDSGEPGFLLSNGQFATRRAAAHLAIRNGQIAAVAHPAHGLYSEDLW